MIGLWDNKKFYFLLFTRHRCVIYPHSQMPEFYHIHHQIISFVKKLISILITYKMLKSKDFMR